MGATDWRLIALDLDGTLIRTDETVSERNRRAIDEARRAGIEVTFATGRTRQGRVEELVQDLKLSVPYVTVNGGEVWTPAGDRLTQHLHRIEDILWMHSLARSTGAGFWATTVNGIYRAPEFPQHPEDFEWLKFGFTASDEKTIRHLWETLEARGTLQLTNSHPLDIELNPAGVTKASGLQLVCDKLGIQPHQVAVMGDSLNDIPMIEWAGRGIAMGNAQPPVKAVAKFQTGHHMEDGVAQAIEELLS